MLENAGIASEKRYTNFIIQIYYKVINIKILKQSNKCANIIQLLTTEVLDMMCY